MNKKFLALCLILALLIGVLIAYFSYRKQRDEQFLVLYGNVDVRQVDLGFRVGGLVESMPFQEGDLVKQGQLMARLDPQPYLDQVKQAESQVEALKKTLENSQLIYKRRQELIGDGSVSQEDYTNSLSSRDVNSANLKEAEASLGIAKTNLDFTHIFCPNDGYILTRVREPGAVVVISEPVYTLSLISPVWVRAYVTERDLGRIYFGMPADVLTDTPGGKIYHGHIGFISPVSEFTPKTVETTQLRTDLVYRLRVIVDNPDQGLRQGMPVTVQLPLHKPERPKSAGSL